MRNLVRCAVLTLSLLVAFAIFYGLCADDGQHGKHHRYRGGSHGGVRREHDPNRATHLTAVTNETYKEACGVCHFAYQPGLLPSGSWVKILSHLEDHFGATVEIDAGPKEVVQKYLIDNAAEKSLWKRSRKIVRCLKGETPVRITEIPYIGRKHRNIPPEIFKRKSVGSLSNCSACHRTADRGVYEDDNVIIPK
jgi:hypothetical protein